MLLGVWENVADLELKISMDELYAILEAGRNREYEKNKFLAALQGIDLEAASKEDIEERFEAVRRRAEARERGVDVEIIEYDEMGIDVETE
jgi:hypothetical protein